VRRTLWLVRAWLRRRGWLPPEVLPAGARLTTYNIGRGAKVKGARPGTLDRVAATVRPDVVALQEVHEPDVAVIAGFLRDDHDLGYHHVFAETVAAEVFAGRRSRDRVGAYGIALLSREPLAPVRVEVLPGKGERRVALIARTALAGTEVTVVATHLATATTALRRGGQTRRVLELAAAEPGPVVVAGDLNQEPGSVDAALREVGSDLVPAGDPGAPTFGTSVIDHVLVGPGLVAVGAVVGEAGVSDHRPLTVALRVDPPR
jgi:endonuclease/exonuclease/phosphatase family metal-dependent hydrolase